MNFTLHNKFFIGFEFNELTSKSCDVFFFDTLEKKSCDVTMTIMYTKFRLN